jgi:phosphoglycolate phosphatase
MLLLYRKKREKSTHGFWYERQCFETEGKIGRAGKTTAKKVVKNAKKRIKDIRMEKKIYTHVIWDFNGTVYDDVDACIQSANRLLEAYSLAPLPSKEEYRAKFGFPIIEYYARLGFDFERYPYAKLAVEWVDYYMELSANSKVYEEIPSVLDAVRERGQEQWILSATEANMLKGQLRSLGILHCFHGVLGMDNIHAHSKEEIGVAWRRAHPNACALMVGDTDHDAQVAAAMGVDCVLVAKGHQSKERLEQCKCLFVAESATEILPLL